MIRLAFLALAVLAVAGCAPGRNAEPRTAAAYFDTTGRDDLLTGGVKMIPITTP